MTQEDNHILLKGIRIYSEDKIIENGYITIKNQKITGLGTMDETIIGEDFEVIEAPAHFNAVPGFIDVHIHGVNGADTMDGTKEALNTMTVALPKEGTTSFLATTMTQEGKQIENALINAGEYIEKQTANGNAEILGLHLEGPFVNPKKAGAQPIQHIVNPNIALFEEWQKLSNGTIKLVTLAPEQPGGLEMIRYLKENGIIASLGHTDATYEQVGEAIEAGANHVTHLFNQMRGLHHREPGVVGAAFLRKELKAEIIVDGVHVHPEMVNLAYKNKQSDGLILITDSMRAKCLKNGLYDLGGQEVTVKDGKAVLADGTLAGSILKLGHAIKNILTYTGCSLEEAVEMASVNPAKQLNVFDRKGSISIGKDADIVILDENMDVYMTFCRGTLSYKKGGKLPMKIIEVKDYTEMSQKAAEYIIEKVCQNPKINLGLATGGTPVGTYKNLIEDHEKNGTSYQNVTTFNLDEYIGLSGENKNSYRYFMDEKLFNHIDINKNNTNIPRGDCKDIEEECLRYESLLANYGGIDLQILGIGSNGHIGFNEPGTTFTSQTHVIKLAPSTINANARFFKSIEEVPTKAITMGISTIMKSKEILLLVSGENKKEAIGKLLTGKVSESFPASVLKNHPCVTIIADKAAISGLKSHCQ